MAHVERRTRNGRTVWRARYRGPDGRERSKSFMKKSDAELWLDTMRGDLAYGTWVDPAGGRTPFEVYALAWQASRVHRPTTQVMVESHLRNHILPRFAGRPLGSFRRSEIQAFVKELSQRLAPATVEVVYRYLASIFKNAVADRLIAVSPCDRIVLPKRARTLVTPLETEQVRAVIAAVPMRYRALVVTAAGTGLRQGEVFGLTLPHVDFLRKRLHVVQQLVLVQNRPPFLAAPKTPSSVRTVPLPDVVIDALALHLRDHPAQAEGLVFTNEHDQGISRTRFSDRVWRPAVKRAGVPTGTGFHALRHYYASLLIRHGESVKVVQQRLGHASAVETLDTYSHLWPDSEDLTRQAVDEVLGELPRPHRGPRAGPERVPAGQRQGGGEPACTPDSVQALACPGRPSLSADGCPPAPAAYPGRRGRAALSLLGLAPGGVYRAARVTPGAGALLPHRFTLTCAGSAGHRRSVLCGTVLRVTPTGRYPAPCPVESGRSSDRSMPVRGRPAGSPPQPLSRICVHFAPPARWHRGALPAEQRRDCVLHGEARVLLAESIETAPEVPRHPGEDRVDGRDDAPAPSVVVARQLLREHAADLVARRTLRELLAAGGDLRTVGSGGRGPSERPDRFVDLRPLPAQLGDALVERCVRVDDRDDREDHLRRSRRDVSIEVLERRVVHEDRPLRDSGTGRDLRRAGVRCSFTEELGERVDDGLAGPLRASCMTVDRS